MFSGGERRCVRFLFLLVVVATFLIIIYTPERKTHVPKQVIGWELNVTRETRSYIIPENETYIISGKEICRDNNIEAVIVVHSAPEHFAQRNAIRETWASHNISSLRTAFLLGSSRNVTLQSAIEEESGEYGDIVQEDFIDSYNNLTIKSVMMLKWFLSQCSSSRYLMKTDDDMFIHVKNFFKFISKARSSSLLIGTLICRAKPILDFSNKWYTPKYIYRKSFYPNYLSGTAYVMSRDVVHKIYFAALSTPLIHLEDVYITGICAAKAGIKPQNNAGFSYQHLGIGCDMNMITNHRLTPRQLHQVWEQRDNCTLRTRSSLSSSSRGRHRVNPCH